MSFTLEELKNFVNSDIVWKVYKLKIKPGTKINWSKFHISKIKQESK